MTQILHRRAGTLGPAPAGHAISPLEPEMDPLDIDTMLDTYARKFPNLSAKQGLAVWQKLTPVALLLILTILTLLSPRTAVVTLLVITNLAYPLNGAFKLLAAWVGRHGPTDDVPLLTDEELPIYTVLLPMYDEAGMVRPLIEGLQQLDYPAAKLDVLILLEECDTATREAAEALDLPDGFRVVVVPDGSPRTKPRACTYGIAFARGEYVVIFDAEDRPDPGQLRLAASTFVGDDPRGNRRSPLGCLQAALNYRNPTTNLLTRMFTVEYTFWFNAMIPGLVRLGIPIPLGGTSNHFPTDVLRQVGAWDPYNVTEDADLGMRLHAHGYRTGVIRSTTWEEACSQGMPWVKQRTRWIKGYLMTAAVYLRRPFPSQLDTSYTHGLERVPCLLFLILGTPAVFLSYPISAAFSVLAFVEMRQMQLYLPDWLVALGWLNMVALTSLTILAHALAVRPTYGWRLAGYSLVLPVYWAMHAVAAWRAAFQLVHSPFSWEKTPHGLVPEAEDEAAAPRPSELAPRTHRGRRGAADDSGASEKEHAA